jgi:hypothetical protein
MSRKRKHPDISMEEMIEEAALEGSSFPTRDWVYRIRMLQALDRYLIFKGIKDLNFSRNQWTVLLALVDEMNYSTDLTPTDS